jgi:drug/metabolite transporter (DMT)-like permease
VSGRRLGYVLVLLAASLWALNGNVVKPLFRGGTSPVLVAQLRMLFTCVLAGIVILAVRPAWLRVTPRELPAYALFGVAGLAAVQFTYFQAIALLPIGVAVLLQYLAPVLLVVYERLFGNEAFDRRVLAGLGCSVVGCFFAVGAYRADFVRLNLAGTGVALLSAVCFAFYTTQAAHLVRRRPVPTVLFYGFLFGSLFWLAYDAVLRPDYPLSGGVLALMLGSAFLGTLVPFGLLIAALRVLAPSRAGITSTLEPVLAGGIAFFWFGETLEPLQLVGAVLVLVGIVLVQLEAPPASLPVPG